MLAQARVRVQLAHLYVMQRREGVPKDGAVFAQVRATTIFAAMIGELAFPLAVGALRQIHRVCTPTQPKVLEHEKLAPLGHPSQDWVSLQRVSM